MNRSKLLRVYGFPATSSPAQLVRTSFTGLRGVIGSWQLLLGLGLGLGRLYLLSDSLDKNLAKAETEIGAKSKEALLALRGSRLALLGGGMEVLGITLREGFKHASASGFAGSAFNSGVALVKTGSIISTVAGFYDVAQTVSLTKTAFFAGDTNALGGYLMASALYLAGTSYAVMAVHTPLLLGPLGLAITMGMLAYGFMRWARKNESIPFERWARRCYFGKTNETPVIHWNTPELADIAFAEFNAATLGLDVFIEFASEKTNPTASEKPGGLVNLNLDRKIKFNIKIPEFNKHRSSYRWHLIVHRQGDSIGYRHNRGEEVASDEFCLPSGATASLAISNMNPSPPLNSLTTEESL
ncbi:hypothetical protein [Pseudomonas guariconensis]|uniref:hypothetical protein n=1 Tax=Pseudomonas guariconensis TaxID=1288410 RepID=UPI0018AB0072|nr:hypothetical protein [Pseudomonas guariconensis]MBF8724262.1 hypothetical protein [Pseudomonas guariconensis]